MSQAQTTQDTCAGCRRRFAEPQRHRAGALCEDCLHAEEQPR